jgi:hypothetical protein
MSRASIEFSELSVWRQSNISTVALRVIGGDEKESLESDKVKYGRQFHGT